MIGSQSDFFVIVIARFKMIYVWSGRKGERGRKGKGGEREKEWLRIYVCRLCGEHSPSCNYSNRFCCSQAAIGICKWMSCGCVPTQLYGHWNYMYFSSFDFSSITSKHKTILSLWALQKQIVGHIWPADSVCCPNPHPNSDRAFLWNYDWLKFGGF